MINFYLIEKADEQKFTEVLSSVKQFLKERLSGAIEDPVLQLATGGANPFFLKTSTGILWVRVFEERFTARDLSALRQDMERVSHMFHQKVRFYLFAPGYEPNLQISDTAFAENLFFEYFFLRSRFGKGVALREALLKTERPHPVAPSKPAQLWNTRLEREELSDLINLSLELKGLTPVI